NGKGQVAAAQSQVRQGRWPGIGAYDCATDADRPGTLRVTPRRTAGPAARDTVWVRALTARSRCGRLRECKRLSQVRGMGGPDDAARQWLSGRQAPCLRLRCRRLLPAAGARDAGLAADLGESSLTSHDWKEKRGNAT